jgi:hypothetical protein
MPADVALWLHVEKPSRVASLAQELAVPVDDFCGQAPLADCLGFVDLGHPVDAAAGGEDFDDFAVAFSVASAGVFREHAEKLFHVTEPRPGTLQLVDKDSADIDGGAAGRKDDNTPSLCDVSTADDSHLVVCGNEEGLAKLGPWLRTSPRPASSTDLVRLEIFPGPVVAAADKATTGDKARARERRAFAHDFGGATLGLGGADSAGAPLALGLDVKMKQARSKWTRLLLTPTSDAKVPDSFARLSQDATALIYVPGGGPMAALLNGLATLASLVPVDPGKLQGVVGEVRALLARGVGCANVIDFDEARAELARAHKAPDKDREKAKAALDAAFESHAVCGVEEPIGAAEKLAHEIVDLLPKTPGDTFAVRPAANLGLPKGSFLVESTSRSAAPSASHTKKPSAPAKSDVIAVPDGETTWLLAGGDLRLTARLATRILQRPKGPLPGLDAPTGTIAAGYLTSLFGAFFKDLESHSLDKLDASLATASPGLLRFGLSQHAEGSGGTLSVHMSADGATLKALPERFSTAMMFAGLLALTAALPDTSAIGPTP